MNRANMQNRAERAFTVTEMLAVVAIVVVLVLIAVPSFQAMVRSSEEAMAESMLATAIKTGRDAAFRAGTGNDAAIVFFFEPGGRCTAVPYVIAGSIRDLSYEASPRAGSEVEREVFVPAPEFSPIRMPRYWNVRAHIPSGEMNPAGELYWSSGGGAHYETTGMNWAFPETGFYDATQNNAGRRRSTFMVRFEGGTGRVVASPGNNILAVAPRNSRSNALGWQTRDNLAPTQAPWNSDLGRYVRMVLTSRDINEQRDAIGRLSSDVVLARPVSVLALYNEQHLAAALGVRLDRASDSLFQDPSESSGEVTLMSGTDPNPQRRINRWFTGDTNNDGNIGGDVGALDNAQRDVPLAKLYAIDRISGALRRMEVQP